MCVFVFCPGIAGKAWVPKKIVDPIMENVTLEPELEEALASASDAELCDIAGKVTYCCTLHKNGKKSLSALSPYSPGLFELEFPPSGS